jgi:hypothetical protein
MEIVLGILLLFGAFTLGAVSSDSTDHEAHATHMESDGTTHQVQAVAASSLQKCQPSESAHHYRDLTVPLRQPAAQQPTQSDDIEDNGWDE